MRKKTTKTWKSGHASPSQWQGRAGDGPLLTNPHAPGMAGAFVPLMNNDASVKAFGVKAGDKMWRDPKDRVKIW